MGADLVLSAGSSFAEAAVDVAGWFDGDGVPCDVRDLAAELRSGTLSGTAARYLDNSPRCIAERAERAEWLADLAIQKAEPGPTWILPPSLTEMFA